MTESMDVLLSLGLKEQKAKETLKNDTLTRTILELCDEVKKLGADHTDVGMILYQFAGNLKPQIKQFVPFVVPYIVQKKLNSSLRIEAAIEYLLSHATQPNLDSSDFEKACGIGITVTPEDVELAVEKTINKFKEEIIEKRYRFNTGLLLQDVRKCLKWADFKDVKNEIDVQMLDLLGPKTDEDYLRSQTKRKDNTTKPKKLSGNGSSGPLTIDDMISTLNLHSPGENFKSADYIITPNTKQLLQDHLKMTGGRVQTRFPPEPNGILHIGHAKAININFGYAAHHNGICYLRYDDTNPEKEEQKFFDGILEMVQWLGYKPYKITHSSDYFDQLYNWAVELIKKGHAYVCHQKQDEIKGFNPPPSPYRNRSVKENLELFEDMKNGKMKEGECSLRMKVKLEEGKQDPVAYRIKFTSHPRTGDQWCIYPTYDYTHCLCDSIENITHSLCTKEFQSRRSSYYWLCNALDLYCPVQWEYGRLNINYTVVSKRKIAKLIECGKVKDWDDPRLFTLTALRRRGFPPEAIHRFCAQVGVTCAQTVVDPSMLESCVRDVLNQTAPRTMVVIKPLEVEIVSGWDGEEAFSMPDYPFDQNSTSHNIKFSPLLYIEQDDFKSNADQGYKRLALNQPVGLRYTPYYIQVKSVVTNEETGVVQKLFVTSHKLTKDTKPKGFIHWVSKPTPVTLRMYYPLFHHKNPEDAAQVPDGFLSDVNDNSLVVLEALADSSLVSNAQPFQQYQFERQGYFCVDQDSNGNHIFFNYTLPLKEDSGKSS
ncbi:probable glutamine--tRNA ligase [Cimex lectularius]|uniref:glutamine--tRNA ligase n=1 Tax=Cimex lectularius TaxID=79782 RepID=A0A8I6RGP1_CIMLE|nr:probable glutamine--tRNA ligase [Cimex lectularius]